MDQAGSLPGLVLRHETKLRRAGLCCANVAKLTLGVVDQVICLVDEHSCQLMIHRGAVNLHMCVVWPKLTLTRQTETFLLQQQMSALPSHDPTLSVI